MSTNYNDARVIAQITLQRKLEERSLSLTSEEIRQEVESAIQLLGCGDVVLEELVADLEASFQTLIGSERMLQAEEESWEPWLRKRKATIDWGFWERYIQYLLREKAWPPATLERLDQTTDRILGLLTAPDRPGAWDRRGMVVGHVQSGKTANYTGLICKAADAGYKLIVVLAGFHKSLRSQTQIRLEEGFLGYDKSASLQGGPRTTLGVGHIDPSRTADSITTRADDGDFKRQVANSFAINPGGYPLLFVIKKNGSVLRNLLRWVEWAANAKDESGRKYVRDVPLLVIDDEADLGSIDTRDGAFDEDGNPDNEHDPTVLNRRIRLLLHLFDRSAYVGYTATPFANIFIHERGRTQREGEDLFPRSFIISLPTPSNYVGPATVFGYESQDGESQPGLPIIRTVADHADSLLLNERSGWVPPKHNKHHVPRYEGLDELPPSLKQAMRAFVLVCAARLARGQETEHNSMLIHVTRFTAVQHRVVEHVELELLDLNRRLRYGDGESSFQIRDELRRLWEEDFRSTSNQVGGGGFKDHVHEWGQIEPYLERAGMSIKVREINGQAGEVLDYINHEATGLNVIAVGGDKLSRGLTLEGLSVSYFLRASRMYDTLMQMGRWFGYRPGYLDLCRLYTTSEMADWFSHIASASEELREDFSRMAASGATPREFGHRVRSHPLMLVTSRVKMRHGSELDITFEGSISETIDFWRDRARLEQNWNAAVHLIEELERSGVSPMPHGGSKESASKGPWSWKNASAEAVIAFLTVFHEHDASRKVKTELLAAYIRKEVDNNRLTSWTVYVASGKSNTPQELGSSTFRLAQRRWKLTGGEADKRILIEQNHYRIGRLVSPVDELIDLSDQEFDRALQFTKEDWLADPRGRNEPDDPTGPHIRRARDSRRGLLLLYPLDPDDAGDNIHDTDKVQAGARDIPVLGFAISFPHVDFKRASKVRYVVNNVYYQQELFAPLGDADARHDYTD